MHAMMRMYSGSGAKQLFDLFEQRKSEVESVLRAVPGLVSYTMARSGDGGMTCTVCDSKAGVEQSMRVAREWIQKNASAVGASPPMVSEGTVVVHIK